MTFIVTLQRMGDEESYHDPDGLWQALTPPFMGIVGYGLTREEGVGAYRFGVAQDGCRLAGDG